MTGFIQGQFPVYIVHYRFMHHASATGYDRLADYIGENVAVPESLAAMGETWLRIPSKIMATWSGVRLYGRRDVVTEWYVQHHMTRHAPAIYHVVYGEKSYRYLHASRKRGHRLLATFHNPVAQYSDLFRTTSHFRRLDFATVVSTHQVEFMEGLVGKGRVTFVPYGVDVDYFSPDMENRASDAPIRCFFGGYHWRDFEGLPAIVEGILRAAPTAEFVLVCDNDICKQLARHKQVRWFSRLSDEDYRKAIRQADLLVLPLKQSTAVGTVLECLASGVPVITHRGGIEDYVIPECSVLLPVGDVQGMIDAAVGLINDTPARRAMAQAARRHALRFAWPEVAKQMSDVYKRLS